MKLLSLLLSGMMLGMTMTSCETKQSEPLPNWKYPIVCVLKTTAIYSSDRKCYVSVYWIKDSTGTEYSITDNADFMQEGQTITNPIHSINPEKK